MYIIERGDKKERNQKKPNSQKNTPIWETIWKSKKKGVQKSFPKSMKFLTIWLFLISLFFVTPL